MLRRIAVVVRREYLERVRTKAFWISTAIVPVFMGAMMVIPAWLAARGAGSFSIAVLDLTGRYAEAISEEVAERLGDDGEALSVELVAVAADGDGETARERLKNEVQEGDWDGVLVLPSTLPGEGEPEYLAPNVTAFRLLATLERAVNDVVVADRLTGAGLDPERVSELTRRAELKTIKLGAKGEETRDQGQTFMLSYAFVMIIFASVLTYGMYVMRGVLEEKSSRIVEVIVSAVKPFELMLGKILGIGAVGLTQFVLWGVLMFALTAPGAAGLMGLPELPTVGVATIVFFVVYFILGFLLYGSLYAGIGAAFDSEQEAQNFQGVISIFLILPILLMFQIFNQPDGTLSVVLSLFPFFTPMLMFLRMTLVQVPPVQIALSIVLMLVAILVMAWLVGKVYRIGILMHGSKPKLKELLRWLREA
jgi:ABC-2 type transport system permease protein